MRTIIAMPALPRMTGGLAVLCQVAMRLRENGFPVAIAAMDGAPDLTEEHIAGLPLLSWDTVRGKKGSGLGPGDLLLIPEGWPGMAGPALSAGCRLMVYVQNWAYLFSALPEGARWQNIPASFMAVSDPVARFLDDVRLPVRGIVRPCINTELFHPAALPDATRAVRIAWMPRKNKWLANQIRQILGALLHNGEPVEWVPISGMSPAQVGKTLASCHVFLATGFPEGFALPPLEAMACGCPVVGFSGVGGWDFMRQAIPGTYIPNFPLRSVSWGGQWSLCL